jgi:uncharacterized protein YdeI (YjbR/CyaY-like superfamily)
MAKRDPRIDAYISKSAPFAQPILGYLREVVHGACPEAVETIKWGFPHFQYEGMLCSMASFKEHCAFGFWKGALLFGGGGEREAMGHFGRITKRSDLPPKGQITRLIEEAMRLNEQGVKSPARARPKAPPEPVAVPKDLAASLKKNAKASATFDAMSPSKRREYADWVTEAKGEDTRKRRVATAVEWLAEGKSRNWKYERC